MNAVMRDRNDELLARDTEGRAEFDLIQALRASTRELGEIRTAAIVAEELQRPAARMVAALAKPFPLPAKPF